MKNEAVSGIVRTQWEAEGVVADLQANGFSANDIAVLFPNEVSGHPVARGRRSKALLGAVLGCVLVGLLGAVVGFLAGIGVWAIPGLGLLVASGPVKAVGIGLGVGALLGAVVGGVLGHAFSRLRANALDSQMKNGNVLVSVHTEDQQQIDVATSTLEAHRAVGISRRTEESPMSAPQLPAHTAVGL